MTPNFNTNQEYSIMHVWCKFGDSISNLWRVILCRQCKVYWRMDRQIAGRRAGRKDGRMQVTKIPLRPESPRGKKLNGNVTKVNEIFITGCIRSCQNDKLECSQWQKFHQRNYIFILVVLIMCILGGINHKSDKQPHMILRLTYRMTLGVTWQLFDTSDVKRRNTFSCLDQYKCNVLRLWKSQDHETV